MAAPVVTLKGVGGFEFDLPTGLFINNEFVPSVKGLTLDVENPATGETLTTIASAGVEDVNKAVAAAQAAFPGWRATPPLEKSKLLWKLAELLEKPENRQVLQSIDVLDVGAPAAMVDFTLPQCIDNLRYYAGWADKITGKTLHVPGGHAYTVREPIGVCAGIVPWNTPLMIAVWKLAPALATGNVLILKMPELAPLCGLRFAQLIKEAGFPPGVVNIIAGEGRVAGQALAEHMDIRKVSFTGGGVTGRKILRAAADSNLKKVTLELGGKGPTIVFDDAQFENALFWAFMGFTMHNGQICVAGTRIYVQEGIYDRFIEAFRQKLAASSKSPKVQGGSGAEGAGKTPVISKLQHEKIMAYIESGTKEGATLLGGGNKIGDKGYFVEETAFADVKPDAKIMKEEIFGPVASIAKFKTEDEVIAAANDSAYGLNAAVFSSNPDRIRKVSDALEVGTVTVNYWGALNMNTPFGGVKESGFGREMGEEALDGWTHVKTVKQLSLPTA
ncbi:hypothetical protein DL767_011025 [Monosporascus sp. MG133]|nr:hypothetical protein DL767_011025 [Monosporascus sp. MG133]